VRKLSNPDFKEFYRIEMSLSRIYREAHTRIIGNFRRGLRGGFKPSLQASLMGRGNILTFRMRLRAKTLNAYFLLDIILSLYRLPSPGALEDEKRQGK
jgi:hypothetical protein